MGIAFGGNALVTRKIEGMKTRTGVGSSKINASTFAFSVPVALKSKNLFSLFDRRNHPFRLLPSPRPSLSRRRTVFWFNPSSLQLTYALPAHNPRTVNCPVQFLQLLLQFGSIFCQAGINLTSEVHQ